MHHKTLFRPSKQPSMVRTFLKVYGARLLFLFRLHHHHRAMLWSAYCKYILASMATATGVLLLLQPASSSKMSPKGVIVGFLLLLPKPSPPQPAQLLRYQKRPNVCSAMKKKPRAQVPPSTAFVTHRQPLQCLCCGRDLMSSEIVTQVFVSKVSEI